MKTLWFICCILFLCYSCHTPREPKAYRELEIDVDDAEVVTDEPALQVVKYVKLETDEKCLLESVRKILVRDDVIFVLSHYGGNVMAFDMSGKFLYKINKGRGPGEIISPTDIAIDEEKKQLLILDLYKNVKRYDFDGKFSGEQKVASTYTHLASLGEALICFDSYFSSSDHFITLIDKQGSRHQLLKKQPKLNRSMLSTPLSRYNSDTLLVHTPFSDTIFALTQVPPYLTPYYVLNFKGKSANTPDRLENIKDRSEYQKHIQYVQGGSIKFLSYPCFLFDITYKEDYFVVYDLQKDKYKFHTRQFSGLPKIYVAQGNEKDTLLFAMDMPRLMSYFQKNPLNGSESPVVQQLRKECNDEEDNPVILFCQF